MPLPKVPQSKCHAARRAADVADARCAASPRGIDPAAAGLGALANLKTIRRELRERVIAPGGNEFEALADIVGKLLDRRTSLARELRPFYRHARVPPQTGEIAHAFRPKPVPLARETHVAI